MMNAGCGRTAPVFILQRAGLPREVQLFTGTEDGKMRAFLFIMWIACGSLHAQESKKTIAVLEFQSSGGLEKSELQALTNRFRGIMVQTNAFEVIEREKMGEILREQDFAISDQCNTSECAVQIGQLLGVRYMIAGDIGKVGQMYTIDLRMIDVSTGKIITTKSEDYEGKVEGLLNVMKSIAGAFAGLDGGSAASAGTGDIYIVSNPSRSVIYIDGKQTEWVTPKLLEGVTAGKHVIEARNGELVARKEIDLKKGGIENIDLKLGKITVPVKITSEPAGASIYINDRESGVTPMVVNVPAGSHKVRVRKSGYEEYSDSLAIREGEASKSLQAALRRLFTLTVKPVLPKDVTAKSVEVIVDDKIRRNDRLSLELPEGKHIIKVVTNLEILSEFSKIVNLKSDQTVEANLEYTYEYQEKLKADQQKALAEKQRLEKEKLEKILMEQKQKEDGQKQLAEKERLEKEKKQKEQEQLALKEEMERKAREAKEVKERLDKEARAKKGSQATGKSNMKWYIIGGVALAGGGGAAVVLLGKKGGGGSKSALPLPTWPF